MTLRWTGGSAKFLAALAVTTILSGVPRLGSHAAADDDSSTTTRIKHVVVIFQENVSFDHYFGTYPSAPNPAGQPKFTAREDTPAVNGLPPGLLTANPNRNAQGQTINPFRLDRSQPITCSQNHDYTDEQRASDAGLMDKFVTVAFETGHTGGGCNADGSTVMGYYDGNTVTALWNYAQHFALSDNSYGSTFGPSTPGALNLIAGQTHGVVRTSGNTSSDVAQNSVIGDPDPIFDDCSNPHVDQVGLQGRNVGDLLNAQHITWGWFQGGFAPTAAATFDAQGNVKTPAVCGQTSAGHPGVDPNNPQDPVHAPTTNYSPHHQPFQYYAQTANPHHLPPTSTAMIGKTDRANHQYDLADFWSAVDSGHMPAVSYLKASRPQDGHAGNSDPLSEQIFLVDTINRLQQRPEWKDTAVVIAWDDSDGWYDHVAGPIVNPSSVPGVDVFAGANCGTPAAGAFQGRCGYGPRLPLLVVSPFAKRNFVDHTTTDQASVLRFIEDNWNLGRIDGPNPPPAGQASFDQIAGSLLSMFDFDDHPHTRTLVLDPLTGMVVQLAED